MTPSGLAERIREEAAKSDPAGARLAAFILSSRGTVIDSTLTSLAEAAGVSYATVCRFVKRMDCGGFKNFRSMLRQTPVLPAVDTPDGADAENIIASVCDISAAITESCRLSMDAAMLERVTSLLLGAGQICLAGFGTSAVSAHYAYIKLFRLGLPCAWDTDMILLRMKASLLGRGDVLFAVSSSGRTHAMLEIAEVARMSGAAVISLCDYASSPLSRVSDICLCTTSRDSGLDPGADLPLIQGQLTLIDILYARLFRLTGGKGFRRTKESAERVKTRSEEA